MITLSKSTTSTRKETSLERANKVRQERANSRNKHLGKEFENGVAKTNWPKVINALWFISLRRLGGRQR